jgi:uncharacterized membrane protein YiaA
MRLTGGDSVPFRVTQQVARNIMKSQSQRPTAAFIGASWAALAAGVIAYLVGLWNAQMQLNEKGYYFTVLMYGLFSAVSLQKSVRDQMQGIPVTDVYFGMCWSSLGISIALLAVGLWNSSLALSEKGFYAMSFVLSLFAAVTVQKNVRDIQPLPDDSLT